MRPKPWNVVVSTGALDGAPVSISGAIDDFTPGRGADVNRDEINWGALGFSAGCCRDGPA